MSSHFVLYRKKPLLSSNPLPPMHFSINKRPLADETYLVRVSKAILVAPGIQDIAI